MLVDITDDFDLKKIADSGQCFRWQEYADPESGLSGYAIPVGNHILHIVPTAEANRYSVSCTEEEWNGFWSDYFDLQTSYVDIRARIEKENDPYLAAAADSGRGIRILRQDPWETLITFIISQRKSIPAIRGCVEKLCRMAGEKVQDIPSTEVQHVITAWSKQAESDTANENPGIVCYSFPTARQLAAFSTDQLSACGLGYRTKYIAEVSCLAAEGQLDFSSMQQLADDDLLAVLMALPGVGIKVASCVMLFGFHRMNAFPKDVWINRLLQEHYPEGFPLDRYEPYNGVMQQYLFWYRRQESL